MASSDLTEGTVAIKILLAILASLALGSVVRRRFRAGQNLTRMHLAFWTTLTVLGLFLCSVLNTIFNWSVLFVFAWVLLAIPLTFLGFVLAFLAPEEERLELALANVFLFALTLSSIVFID
jgi:ABC-type polysaccharide/polyol phosphate export permease